MPVKVILGLPYLSSGALTQAAKELNAPVLLSANSFAKWKDEGPMPERHSSRRQGANAGRQLRHRTWQGWNLGQLQHAHDLPEIVLDSAGFVAQFSYGGFPWTPEDYIFGLAAQYPFTRFASLDCCVEQEIARDRDEVRERISKTIALNRECLRLSKEAGIADRLMHVIQGATIDDYLSCFDRMHGMICDEALIGVGSMCRRKTHGNDGIIAIVEALDRELPPGVQFHLFGLKSQGAASVAMLDHRVASIDSQAYGVRARRLAIEQRQIDPAFSKTNVFVAGIMKSWWLNQVDQMERGQKATLQNQLPMPQPQEPKPSTVFDALMLRARAEFNQLIENGELAADEIIPDTWVLESAQAWISALPSNVRAYHPYHGIWQMPEDVQENWPNIVNLDILHPSLWPAEDLPLAV